MNQESIKILLIEDNPGDRRIVQEVLSEVRSVSFKLEWADRLSAGLERLTDGNIDLVLLDLGLPDSQGIDTLDKVQAQAPKVPIVVMTGLDDEELAIEALQRNAQDYQVKGQVNSGMLSRVIRYAIERKRMVEEREKLILELQEALANVKKLSGLLPICTSCKKIRDDKGYWNKIEAYIYEHSEADFTHSICPECMEKLYPKEEDD
jgi:DNA-binding NtrC family response regulator